MWDWGGGRGGDVGWGEVGMMGGERWESCIANGCTHDTQ
jgi:hypothetical protein